MAKKRVSISPIGAVIRKKQRELRSAKKGRTKAEQNKIDLKIQALDKHYKAVKALCFPAGWKVG